MPRDLADLVESFGGAPLMDVIRVAEGAGDGNSKLACQGAGMKGVGTDIGTIHFVGIGGIGMSGIAEVMHNLGYDVQGSATSPKAMSSKGCARAASR
jgi:hypothetical protein